MFSASPSGLLTLGALFLGGPLLLWLWERIPRGRASDEEAQARSMSLQLSEQASEREEVGMYEYLIGLVGYSIGIGNLWRFPYLVGKWGGGAFMVAYLCSLLLVAIPLYLLELGVGQYTRRTSLSCMRMIHPRWAGLGISQPLMIFIVLSYFNVLIAYATVYAGGSLVEPLPWSEAASERQLTGQGAAEAYWTRDVLNVYGAEEEGRDALGPLQWRLVAAMVFVWVVMFWSLAFGKQVLAKVTSVMVFGPCAVLTIMLFQVSRLEGAGSGLQFYIGKFELDKLASIEMWATACSQILFSLSPGFGTTISLSSYARRNEDVFKVCAIVSISNSTFSIIGGFAIFGILGNLALRTGRTVEAVAAQGGTGLTFIAIAEGIQTFGWMSNTMALLFFVVLMALGLGSSFAWAETILSIADDTLKEYRLRVPRLVLTACLCVSSCLLGLMYCTRLGNNVLSVVDHYVGSMFLLFACCFETVAFNTGFTFERLREGIKAATLGGASTPLGREIWPEQSWRLTMKAVPFVTGSLFLLIVLADVLSPFGGGEHPWGLRLLGRMLLGLCIGLALCTIWRTGESELPLMGQGTTEGTREKTDCGVQLGSRRIGV